MGRFFGEGNAAGTKKTEKRKREDELKGFEKRRKESNLGGREDGEKK